MATVIDALVVTLGMNAKDFVSGAAKATTALKSTSSEATKTAKEMEARGKQAAEFFSKIRNEALAMLAVFTAGVGIKNFVENTIVGAASLGRMSQNLGMSTEALSAWQRVAEDAGGTAEGMTAQLKESQKAVAGFKMGQSSESLQWFFRMGGKTSDLKDGNTYLMARSKIISDIFKTDPGKAQLVASQMGISDDQFNLLKQGPALVQAQVAAMEKLSAISAEDARQADELRKKWLQVERTFTLVGIKVVEALMPAFDSLLGYIKQLGDWVVTHKDDITAWVNGAVKAIQSFAKEANKAAESVGGWKNVLIGLAAIKVLAMVAPLLQLAGALGGVGGGLARIALSGPGALIALGLIAEEVRKSAFDKIIPAGPDHDQQVAEAQAGGAVTPNVDAPPAGGFGKLGSWLKKSFGSSEAGRQKQALDYFMSQGWTAAQAAGIVGSLTQESRVDPESKNDKSGAYGIGQWLGSRVTDFKKWSGHDLEGSSLEDQLSFMQFELTKGKEQAAGRKLKASQSAADAAAVHSNAYERPGAEEANIGNRQTYANILYEQLMRTNATAIANQPVGARGLAPSVANTSSTISSEVNINGPITVQTQATDAAGVARGLGAAINKYHFVAQANTGLS